MTIFPPWAKHRPRLRGIRKRIVMITFCDISGCAVTRGKLPAAGLARREARADRRGTHHGPFGIIGFPGAEALSRLLPGGRGRAADGRGGEQQNGQE